MIGNLKSTQACEPKPVFRCNLLLLGSYRNKTFGWDDHPITLLKLTDDHLGLLPPRYAGLAHLSKDWAHFWKGIPPVLHSCSK